MPLERDMSMTLNRLFQSDYNSSYSDQIAASAAGMWTMDDAQKQC